MAVLLDTSALAQRDRRDALITAMRDTSGASQVTLADEPVRGRLELWPFGAAAIFRAESNGVCLTRTAKAARSASGEHIAIGVHGIGTARHRSGPATRALSAGEALLVDVSKPFDYAWSGPGAAQSFNIPVDQLGMPADLVRQASLRLTASPLYGLVSRHIADMASQAETLSASPAAHMLGSAAIELARALIVTALDASPDRRDIVEQTLITQIRAYVRQNLHDPELSPASIAIALALSPRHLYRVCAEAGMSLEQWIISTRLEHAKAELAGPGSRSIASIALRWGFRDPTHFTRRFRAAYGFLPSEWRRMVSR
ncbi:helix-turn-helix domain-containing protein [Kibdelosporangium philippinense]|uniref:Helix-turn-helix domain-containing protein n=1 Tax=Kibdelosporangium philippinense TaxID=211113 RepID=A0ABS8ZTL6_9PSEU|nr:helix-turn-helix domain-containing protein [Kibdelosporangium philippinense]MCE7010330.1 helix-turn-helix domain-containing protein [Kibdelosporangium philippinense]